MWLNALQLAVLTIIAFIAGWAPAAPASQRIVAIVVCALMVLALALTTALRIGHFDDRWFRCRAFAENIKSAAWFFMMANPGPEAEAEFTKEVEEIRERLHEVIKEVTSYESDGDIITEEMKTAQALPQPGKLAFFREQRLDDQRRWYRSKARYNARREQYWFAAIFTIEFLALAYAAMQAWKLWEFNAVGGIAATGAAFVAWLQTKRFSDLGTSYAIAAGDLDGIAAQTIPGDDEAKFNQFVEDVEKAVSREHSMWLARRVL